MKPSGRPADDALRIDLSWPAKGLAYGLLVCLGLVAYSNTMSVPFLLDDAVRIVHNPDIQSLDPRIVMAHTNRPVVQWTFAVNYAIHGLKVEGYHAINLAIHLVSACLVLSLLVRCLPRVGYRSSSAIVLATAIAATWLVHPLHTQAVTYINQRYESLMGMFLLATLWSFLCSQSSSRPWAWQTMSIVFCGLGMGSKEAMVAAPLLVLWLDRSLIANDWITLLKERWMFYLALASTWSILVWSMVHYTGEYTGGGMGQVDHVTPWTYLLSQSEVLVHYIRLTFWPTGLCFWDRWPVAESLWAVLPYSIAIVLLLFATAYCLVRYPPASFLGAWFFLILAPTSSFIPIRDFMFEYRMYCSMLSLLILFYLVLDAILTRWIQDRLHRSSLQIVVAVGIVLGLSSVTFQRNAVYGTERSLWQDTVAKAPHHAAAWHNLGIALVAQRDLSEALPAFAEAVRLSPQDASLRSAYGTALMELQRWDEAQFELQSAIAIQPDHALSLRNLAILAFDRRDYASAMRYGRAAIHKQDDLEAHLTLAASLFMLGMLEEALQESRDTLSQHPHCTAAYLNAAQALCALQRNDQAIALLRDASANEVSNPLIEATLGRLVADEAPKEAISHLKIAYPVSSSKIFADGATEIPDDLRLLWKLQSQHPTTETIGELQAWQEKYPKELTLRYRLVTAFVQLRQLDEAVLAMEEVVRLRPGSINDQAYLDKLRQAAAEQQRSEK